MTIDERQFMFEQFLQSKDCYNVFIQNCKKYKQSYDNDMKSLVMSSLPFSCIDHAFTWKATDEGHDYWNDLAREWSEKFKVYDNRTT